MINVTLGVAGVEAYKARGRGGEVEQGVEREGGRGAEGIEGARGVDHSLHGRKEKGAGKGNILGVALIIINHEFTI